MAESSESSRPDARPAGADRELRAALSEEVRSLERALPVGGMFVASSALLLAPLVWLVGDPPQARAVAVGGLLMIAWFGATGLWLRKRTAGPIYAVITTIVEGAIPAVFILGEMLIADVDIGISRTAVIVTFGIPVILAILRLRPALPVVSGVVSALVYGLSMFLVGRAHGSPAAVALLPPDAILERCFLMIVVGATGSLATRALWRVVSQALQKVRSRDLFGKYRLGARIAAGGMGEVFRATYCPEGGFERDVAIKRIHLHLAESAQFIDSFRAEAALCSHLGHPNIVQVLDFGSIDNTYFYAMEFVDGCALNTVLRRAMAAGRLLPPRLVAFIGREMCAGLHFAHEQARGASGEVLHVVHRDVSPPNVLLSRTGQVKIADFGVAKVLRGEAQTLTTTVAGKLAYMAPEQAARPALRSVRGGHRHLGDALPAQPVPARLRGGDARGAPARRAAGAVLAARGAAPRVGPVLRDGAAAKAGGALPERRPDGGRARRPARARGPAQAGRALQLDLRSPPRRRRGAAARRADLP